MFGWSERCKKCSGIQRKIAVSDPFGNYLVVVCVNQACQNSSFYYHWYYEDSQSRHQP